MTAHKPSHAGDGVVDPVLAQMRNTRIMETTMAMMPTLNRHMSEILSLRFSLSPIMTRRGSAITVQDQQLSDEVQQGFLSLTSQLSQYVSSEGVVKTYDLGSGLSWRSARA